MHYLPIKFSQYRIHDTHKTGSGSERRSQEILGFFEKYGNQASIDLFWVVCTYANKIRQLRGQFGWPLGRLYFYIKHPKIFAIYGLSLQSAIDMF